MRIQTVSSLSGLSRGQIDQLISRYAVGVHGGFVPGGARDFTPADAFNFCIAGRAAALGIDMPTIREIVNSLPMPAVDPSTFRQREIYPGYSRNHNSVLVVHEVEGDFQSQFIDPKKIHLVIKDAAGALVFPASEIGKKIEDAGDE